MITTIHFFTGRLRVSCLQGGGFATPTVAADQAGSDPGCHSSNDGDCSERARQLSILVGRSRWPNLGGQPDSATSQFFFNLSDNSCSSTVTTVATPHLVMSLGSGMTVVDTYGQCPDLRCTVHIIQIQALE